MKKISIFFSLCFLFLQGCFGVGIGTFGSEKYICKSAHTKKEEVLKFNGSPSKVIKTSETEEVIIYNDGLGWSGLMPYISIYLPIALPIGIPTHSLWREYRFVNNELIYETINYTAHAVCFAGYGVGPWLGEKQSGDFDWWFMCKKEKYPNYIHTFGYGCSGV